MMFQEEQAEIDKSFLDLLSRILPRISAKSQNDCVLDDEDGEFKKYFLSIAANKFSDAYHSYLFSARVQRNQDIKLTESKKQPIKIEILDSDESSENEVILADQVTTITQSNPNESECDAQINSNPKNIASNEKCKSITAQKAAPKKGLLFYCPHCNDENKPFDNVELIYEHWATKHAESQKPFQFNVGTLFACNLCERFGTYPELKYHFKIKHPGKQFAVKDPSEETERCGICKFVGNDLAKHFRFEHRFIADLMIVCPMRLPKNIQDALKAIDIHKEYKCMVCLDTFAMEKQILEHYHQTLKHDLQKYPYEVSSIRDSSSFKCNICDCTMDQHQMQYHFKNHEFRCLSCDEFKGKVNEIVYHFRECHPGDSMIRNKLEFGLKFFETLLFYGNGLVLNFANLLKPNDDESSIIQPFFQINTDATMQDARQTESPIKCHLEPLEGISTKIVPYPDPNPYLEEQWPLQNKLIIFGLHMQHHDSDELIYMFSELYKCTTGRPIDDIQIKSIYTEGRKLIVKLEEREQRDTILRSPLLKNLKTDDFLKLSPGVKPIHVYVEPMLTKHYLKIAKRVRYYIERQILNSFLMRTWGLAVKNKANSEDVLVNSIEELEKYVVPLLQLKRKQSNKSPERRESKQTKY